MPKKKPSAIGIFCGKCKKPFLVWLTASEGIIAEDVDLEGQLRAGNSISPAENFGDIKNWCSCGS